MEAVASWVNRRRVESYRVDRATWILIGIMLSVHIGAVGLYHYIYSAPEATPPEQTTNAAIGIGIVAFFVFESLLLVGLWILYKRLTGWQRKVVKYVLFMLLLIPMVWLLWLSGLLAPALAFLMVGLVLNEVLERLNYAWVFHDLMAIGFAMAGAEIFATLFAPHVVVVILCLVLVWDHIAVDLSSIMAYLVEFSSSAEIPNYVVLPKGKRVDMDRLKKYMAKDKEDRAKKPDDVEAIIGVGDFVFPAALAVSIFVSAESLIGWLPAATAMIGTCIAFPVLSGALHHRQRGVPALPWLNGGALSGWLVGLAILWILV